MWQLYSVPQEPTQQRVQGGKALPHLHPPTVELLSRQIACADLLGPSQAQGML